jgi:N-acetyl-gamma-glutamyl-phosphate reductase
VGTHRHTPEIEEVLTTIGGAEVKVTFTPHLTPMNRGILATMYPRLKEDTSLDHLKDVYRSYYEGKPFVRIIDRVPTTKDVAGTNYCDISLQSAGNQLIVFSATDNLIKGAAGVAVQNFNLMAGYPETTGLIV